MGINLLGYQTTLRERAEFTGHGVHSGKPVSMSICPADPNSGIIFSVTCPDSGETKDLPATLQSVSATDLCTVLGTPDGPHVATVEHLMAALYALRIDNAIIEIEGREVPVMDGSSAAFIDALEAAGLTSQAAARRHIRVLKPIRVDMGMAWGEFVPYEGTRYEIEIDFACQTIGRQVFCADMTPDVFKRDLSRARTFGFMKDVERLWAAGFALGSSLENSVVIGDDNNVINPEGLRYKDEFVRHKALDAIGDLALAGAPFLGCYRSYRGGHKLNALTLQALLADSSAYEIVDAVPAAGTTRRFAEAGGAVALAGQTL